MIVNHNGLDKIRRLCGYKFPRLGKYINRLFFTLLPYEIDTELFPNIHLMLNLKDLTQRTTYWQGSRFEYPTPQILSAWGGKAKAFFDIGSNYGFYSYWMLYSCSDILVYAFEPNPNTFSILESTKINNNLLRLNNYQIGLGNEVGILGLHPGIEDSGHSTFLPHPAFVQATVTNVPVVTFDKWRECIGLVLPKEPAWIAKIDVEGFEYKVLEGMRESLAAQAFRGISVEVLEHTLSLCGNLPQDVFDIMKVFNYAPVNRISKKNSNVFFIPTDHLRK
jgi:FkbM family methyltransferase